MKQAAHNPNRLSNNSDRGANASPASRQLGLTLVELMVALVLGLVLVGGVLNVFVANRETFRSTENLTRIQENARTGFDFMARDIREAGQNPCGTPLVANVIRKAGAIPWWADWNNGTLIGVDGSQDRTDIVAFGTTDGARVAGTSAAIVIRTDSNERAITAHDASVAAEFTLFSVDGLHKGDIAVACDSLQATVLQLETGAIQDELVTNPVSYTTTDAPFNCSGNLGHPTPTNCATPPLKTFAVGGTLSKLVSSFWYIGFNGTQRALYRVRLANELVASVTTPVLITEMMVPGVQDLQMDYLTGTGTSLASNWVSATNTVFDAGNQAWTTSNLNQVVAVRVNMTLQSEENIGTNQQPIQRQLIHVVALRSRDYLF